MLIELTVLDAEVLTGVALLEAAEAVGIGLVGSGSAVTVEGVPLADSDVTIEVGMMIVAELDVTAEVTKLEPANEVPELMTCEAPPTDELAGDVDG